MTTSARVPERPGPSSRSRVAQVVRIFALAALAFLSCSRQAAADPDALWRIVHEDCEPADQSGAGPGKCALVDRAHRAAVLKDRNGATQYLLIPTDRLTGIEDPALLAPGEPNFWAVAWSARSFVEARAGQPIPRDKLGLAVNSARGRSQNQLHIHIDCVRPEVRASLRQHLAEITLDWRPVPGGIDGKPYLARRLDSPDFADADPFRLLADGLPGARDHMGDYTLAAIPFGDGDGAAAGFILLADQADWIRGDLASSSTLLDHDCAVLKDAGAK